MDIQPVLSLRLRKYRSVSHAALVSHYLVFGACEECREGAPPDELIAADLRSGAVRRLAHSDYVGGQTDWVEGTGSYAVYTDQNRVQDDANPATIWTLNAIDLTNHVTLRLASSHGRPDDGLPSPRAGDGYAVWAQPTSPGPGEVLKVERLRPNAKPGVVARGNQYRDFGVARGRVAFVDGDGRLTVSKIDRPGGAEVFRHDSHAASVRVGEAGNLVWPAPQVGDPSSLWTSRVTHPISSRRIYTGDSQMQVVADDFVAFLRLAGPAGDALSIVSLRGGRPVTVAHNPYIPSRLVARGHLLAYATSAHLFKSNQVTTIHVVRIVDEGSTAQRKGAQN